MEGAAEGPAGLNPWLEGRGQAEDPKDAAEGAQGGAVAGDGEHAGVTERLPAVDHHPLPAAATSSRPRGEVEREGCGGRQHCSQQHSGGEREVANDRCE